MLGTLLHESPIVHNHSVCPIVDQCPSMLSLSEPNNSKLPLERLLLLRVGRDVAALDQQALAPAHAVHVALGDVLLVAELAEVLEVVLGEGHPEGVLVEDFESGEDELGLGGAAGALAHLVGEAEGLGGGDEGEDGEEGGALLHGLGEDAAAAAGEDVVDAAQDFGCGLGMC